MINFNNFQQLQIHPYCPAEDITRTVARPDSSNEEVEEIGENTSIDTKTEVSEQTTNNETSQSAANTTVALDNSYQIEFIYGETPKINICFATADGEQHISDSPQEPLLEKVSAASPSKTREKSNEEKQRNLISILKKVTDKKLEKSPIKKSVNFLLPTPTKPIRSSPRLSERNQSNLTIASTFLLTQKFFIVIESFFTSYIQDLKYLNNGSPLLKRTFHWIKTIDIYLKLIQQSIMTSKKRQNEIPNATDPSTNKTKKNVSSSEEYSKKLHRKLVDNRSLIMQSDRNKCTIEKDCSYAYNYLDRVKKTLTENGDEELFTELMSMLTSFDPEFESVPELYRVSYAT